MSHHTMVRYKSERCPCGKPISTHSFPEYQRHLATAADRPEFGKVYSLTGPGASIANGNSWAESEVAE